MQVYVAPRRRKAPGRRFELANLGEGSMPNFSVSSDKLTVGSVRESDMTPALAMKRGPDLRSMSLPNGPRQYNQRLQSPGAVAAALELASATINENVLSVWLRKWLKV